MDTTLRAAKPAVESGVPEAAAADRRQAFRPSRLRARLASLAPLLVLIALCILLGILAPSFFTFRNLVWGVANHHCQQAAAHIESTVPVGG